MDTVVLLATPGVTTVVGSVVVPSRVPVDDPRPASVMTVPDISLYASRGIGSATGVPGVSADAAPALDDAADEAFRHGGVGWDIVFCLFCSQRWDQQLLKFSGIFTEGIPHVVQEGGVVVRNAFQLRWDVC